MWNLLPSPTGQRAANAARLATRQGRVTAFTLIEVIGVMAVIAILAAVLVPRVLGAIQRGKVSSAAQSLGGLKSAITEYLVRSNAVPSRLGYDATNAATLGGRFDADLVQAGLTDRLFAPAIGLQTNESASGFSCTAPTTSSTLTALLQRSHVRSAPGGAASLTPVSTSISAVNFDLDRNGSGDFAATRMVIYAYIPGVGIADATLLNQVLDGDTPSAGAAELRGRCIQSAPDANNMVTIYVHLGHY